MAPLRQGSSTLWTALMAPSQSPRRSIENAATADRSASRASADRLSRSAAEPGTGQSMSSYLFISASLAASLVLPAP